MTAQDEPEKIFGITESEWQLLFAAVPIKEEKILRDTRSRGPIQPVDFSHIAPDRRGCLTCLNPECPVWQAADQNCWESQKEHDAAIAAKAREEVLDKLREWSIIQYEILGVIDTMDLKQKIESLRSEVKK